MGCKSACICGGFCPGCTDYEPESYCGEAEDRYDDLYGRPQQEQQDNRVQEYYGNIEHDKRKDDQLDKEKTNGDCGTYQRYLNPHLG